jgi:hypothetical protein
MHNRIQIPFVRGFQALANVGQPYTLNYYHKLFIVSIFCYFINDLRKIHPKSVGTLYNFLIDATSTSETNYTFNILTINML